MKKLIFGVLFIFVSVLTLGCVCTEKDTSVSDVTIRTEHGASFSVLLGSNPSTGYEWQLDFDPSFIRLVDREYIPSRPSRPGITGSGGYEIFNFVALKSGKTEITFSYLRSWEEGKAPINIKVYEIIIGLRSPS